MAKMKVHELAKELNVQSKDVVEYLKNNNVEVASHMSVLDEKAASMVKNKFGKKENTVKKDDGEKTAERPKKKASISAVYNPQNSKMGNRRGGQKGQSGNRSDRQDRSSNRTQNDRPARPNRPIKPRPDRLRPSQAIHSEEADEQRPVRNQGERSDRQDRSFNRNQGDRPYNRNQNDRSRNQGERSDRQDRSFNKNQGDRPVRNRQENGDGRYARNERTDRNGQKNVSGTRNVYSDRQGNRNGRQDGASSAREP